MRADKQAAARLGVPGPVGLELEDVLARLDAIRPPAGTGEPSEDGMDAAGDLLVFRVDDRRFALPLAVVNRVVRAVDVTPLPGAPSIVMGAIDVGGRVLPVLNVRRRVAMPEREIRPEDWFLLARTSRRAVALAIDESEGILDRSHAAAAKPAPCPAGLDGFPGVICLADGLVLIHDIDRFLSLDEARALDVALAGETGFERHAAGTAHDNRPGKHRT